MLIVKSEFCDGWLRVVVPRLDAIAGTEVVRIKPEAECTVACCRTCCTCCIGLTKAVMMSMFLLAGPPPPEPPWLWQATHELSLNTGPRPSPPCERGSLGNHSRLNSSLP